MNYNKRLKEIRLENNVLQKEIAEFLNLSYITYSHYETQDTIIPIKHLINICNYFNVSLDYILGFSNNKYINNINKNIDKYLIGERLKKMRKDLGLTQSKLAISIGTDKTVICSYEKGKNIIATPFLYDICKKYNISADYLLGRTNIKKDF